MSASAQANLFYGISTDRETLFQALGFNPDGDHYDEVRNLLSKEGLNLLPLGDQVTDGTEYGVASMNFECDGVVPLPFDSMMEGIDQHRRIWSFVEKYKIDEKPSWFLAASYL